MIRRSKPPTNHKQWFAKYHNKQITLHIIQSMLCASHLSTYKSFQKYILHPLPFDVLSFPIQKKIVQIKLVLLLLVIKHKTDKLILNSVNIYFWGDNFNGYQVISGWIILWALFLSYYMFYIRIVLIWKYWIIDFIKERKHYEKKSYSIWSFLSFIFIAVKFGR